MRLSKGAISYILDLQKNKLPQVCCISNLERFEILKEAIVNYSGKVKLLSNDLEESTGKNNTLCHICVVCCLCRYIDLSLYLDSLQFLEKHP